MPGPSPKIEAKRKKKQIGIIETSIRKSIDKFNATGDKFEFAYNIAYTADYSVRSQHHWGILLDSLRKVKEEENAHIINFIIKLGQFKGVNYE